MTHYLGIDYGKKRVGLAYCSNAEGFVFGLPTFTRSGKALTDVFEHLGRLWQEKRGFDVAVLGLPKNMDGSEGFMAEEVRAFADALQTTFPTLTIRFMDERLSSKASERALIALDMKPSRHKGLVDEASAKRILEDYLRQQELEQEQTP